MRSLIPHRECVNEIPLCSLTAGDVKHGISENPELSESCFAFMHNLHERQLTGRGVNLKCLQ